MDKLLDLTIQNIMSVYKTAFEEGKKLGYEEGKRDAWKEANIHPVFDITHPVFDITHPIEYKNYDIRCPQCNSNACDRQEKESDKNV